MVIKKEYGWGIKQEAVWGFFPTWKNTFSGIRSIFDFAAADCGYTNEDWIREGENYAQTVETAQPVVLERNETNPQVESYQAENGAELIKVGPYNLTMSEKATLQYVKVYDQDNQEVQAQYGRYEGDKLIISQAPIEIIRNQTPFYILLPVDKEIEKISKVDIKIEEQRQDIVADVWLLQTSDGSFQNLITVDAKPTAELASAELSLPEVELLGKLHLQKVNKDDHNVKLDKVTFVFKNRNGKYIKQEGDKITYVDRDQATEFTTDENGEITIDKVIVGTYTAYEVGNEHYGYIAPPEGTEIKVAVDDKVQTIENKQEKIKLSGYVWKDMIFGKDTQRNDLFQDNSYDKNDELMPGIPVRLKSKSTGEVLQEKETDENGAYLFEDVLIEELEDYYIEFEYDGLIYTNVIPHIDVDNGSKAAEGKEERKEFNEKFSTVEGKDASNNIGQTTGPNGEVVNDNLHDNLKYRRGEIGNEEEQYKSFFDYDSQYFPITANTDQTGYSIKSNFAPGVEEIKYINLGVYLRDKPDIAIKKDVQNAMVSINGYNHTYNYASRYENQGEYENGFNVGVKFENNRGTAKYTRPIYKADALYEDPSDDSKDLRVRVTYRIRYRNESTTLGARVNKVVDYYDANYEKVQVATSIDDNGEIVEGSELDFKEITSPDSKYKAIEINAPTTILAPGKSSAPSTQEEEQQVEEDKLNGTYQGVKSEDEKTKEELKGEYNGSDIYVQFTVNKDAVKTILDTNEKDVKDEKEPSALLENVVEITSYTSFDSEENLYAGIDMDSAPGNATPNNLETYEDDTDSAPSFILQYAAGDGRTLNGNVFEDLAEAPKDGGARKERIGNGLFEEAKEHGIENVQIELYELETDENNEVVIGADGKPVIKGLAQRYDKDGNSIDNEKISSSNIGEYTIKGFVPGRYVIKYTWGDGTATYTDGNGKVVYTSENYKSTTQPEDEWNRKMSNPEWYKAYIKDHNDPRYTDAKDDFERRQEIDQMLENQVYGNSKDNLKENMYSYTAPMSLTVEFDDLTVTEVEFDNDGQQVKDAFLEYKVPHVDFGLIERPVQDLQLNKYVSAIRLTLANGQILIDATLDEQGTITGQKDSLTYMLPSTVAPYGTVKLELDEEIMQGATLQVQYKLKAENISEIDYEEQSYYDFGTGGQTLRTLSANEIVDYLDGDWGYDNTLAENSQWTELSTEEMENHKLDANGQQIDKFSNGVINSSEIETRRKLVTDKLAKNLKPGESNETTLTVSKVLASGEGDIELNNEAEITHVYKDKGGRDVKSTPGNYEPGKSLTTMADKESDTGISATTTVTSPTGADAITYVIYTASVIIALVILGTGIVLIKKKVLTK